ncbi:MAG: glycolate oxidase subunit GlcE [Betaproteobacteria bacterium]
MSDPVVDRWAERIRECAASDSTLAITGGGTKLFYGNAVEGELLDTRACTGIVDYSPVELVVVARAGTPLAEVEATLARDRQMLAFEPPHFGAGATLGGAIATGLSGPRRPYAGAARDLVLGVKVIDGNGTPLNFGGRVMKNVAGFDVSRLMTGALGTLGVLTEVSLKCLPMPAAERTQVFECSADEAIRRVNEWSGQALPLSATCFVDGLLAVRLSGATAAIDAALRKLGGSEQVDAAAFWRSVREHAHAFFGAGDAPLWRLSVKSTAPFTDLGGTQLIEWGGALRWLRPQSDVALDVERLRRFSATHGGHATLFRGGDRRDGVFHPLPPVLAGLHQRLKATFDPKRILNRGRMYAGI